MSAARDNGGDDMNGGVVIPSVAAAALPQHDGTASAASTATATALEHDVESECKTSDVAASSPTTPSLPPSSLSSYRPFCRCSFVARVSSYSPLLWSPKSSLSLSPLQCARLGWWCHQSKRDTLACAQCKRMWTMEMVPALTGESDTHPALQSLCASYERQLSAEHDERCPWRGVAADNDFTSILPSFSTLQALKSKVHRARQRQQRRRSMNRSTVVKVGSEYASALKRAITVALHQADERTRSLKHMRQTDEASHGDEGMKGVWRRLQVQPGFIDACKAILKEKADTDSRIRAQENESKEEKDNDAGAVMEASIPVHDITVHDALALCGWEAYPEVEECVCTRDAFSSSTSSVSHSTSTLASTSTSTSTPAPPSTSPSSSPLLVRCWFGCRAAIPLQSFLLEAPSNHHDTQQQQHTSATVTQQERAEEEEEEERKETKAVGADVDQPPSKRRKLGMVEDSSAVVSAHHDSNSIPPSSISIFSLPTSTTGFDPILSHRPFCPFLLPCSTSIDDDVDTAAHSIVDSRQSPSSPSSLISPPAPAHLASSSSTIPPSSRSITTSPQQPHTTPNDHSISGWQQLLRWWCDRGHQRRVEESKLKRAKKQADSAYHAHQSMIRAAHARPSSLSDAATSRMAEQEERLKRMLEQARALGQPCPDTAPDNGTKEATLNVTPRPMKPVDMVS